MEATTEVVKSARTLQLGILGAGEGEASSAKANRETLEEKILAAGADAGVTLTAAGIVLTPLGTGSEAWDTDSQLPFSEWEVVLNLSGDQADVVLNSLRDSMKSEPVWISSSSVGSRVADDMIGRRSVPFCEPCLYCLHLVPFSASHLRVRRCCCTAS